MHTCGFVVVVVVVVVVSCAEEKKRPPFFEVVVSRLHTVNPKTHFSLADSSNVV